MDFHTFVRFAFVASMSTLKRLPQPWSEANWPCKCDTSYNKAGMPLRLCLEPFKILSTNFVVLLIFRPSPQDQ